MPYVAGSLALQRERLAGDRGQHVAPREFEAGRTRRHSRLHSRGSRANELTGGPGILPDSADRLPVCRRLRMTSKMLVGRGSLEGDPPATFQLKRGASPPK
jgi:hypothetical protein